MCIWKCGERCRGGRQRQFHRTSDNFVNMWSIVIIILMCLSNNSINFVISQLMGIFFLLFSAIFPCFFVCLIMACWVSDTVNFTLADAVFILYYHKHYWTLYLDAICYLETVCTSWALLSSFVRQYLSRVSSQVNLFLPLKPRPS